VTGAAAAACGRERTVALMPVGGRPKRQAVPELAVFKVCRWESTSQPHAESRINRWQRSSERHQRRLVLWENAPHSARLFGIGESDKCLSIIPVSNVASAAVEKKCGPNRYVTKGPLYWCDLLRTQIRSRRKIRTAASGAVTLASRGRKPLLCIPWYHISNRSAVVGRNVYFKLLDSEIGAHQTGKSVPTPIGYFISFCKDETIVRARALIEPRGAVVKVAPPTPLHPHHTAALSMHQQRLRQPTS